MQVQVGVYEDHEVASARAEPFPQGIPFSDVLPISDELDARIVGGESGGFFIGVIRAAVVDDDYLVVAAALL